MRRLDEALHDLAEQDDRLPTSELITRIERGLSSEGALTVASMDGRSAMDAQENTREDRRRMPMMVAAGAALLVLIVVGLPILLFGTGDSGVVGQPTTTVALTNTTVPPTSVASTTSTSTATTIPGLSVATEAVLVGLLERLGDTYSRYTSPPEEDYPTDVATIGDLENAIYVVWAPIVVELLDAMEAASANLKSLSDSGHLYDFEQDVDALTVAIDEWLVALRWYHDPNLNCFPLLSDEARNLIVGELWNQTEWAECMNANITAEDMETMKQASVQVKELQDSLMSAIAGAIFNPTAPPPDPGSPPEEIVSGISALVEGASCEEIAAQEFTYAEALSYWVRYELTEDFDLDTDGDPCEAIYADSEVVEVIGESDALSVHLISRHSTGIFLANGPAVDAGLVCPEGTIDYTQEPESEPPVLWRWEDIYTCNDGSGTFLLGVDEYIEDGDAMFGVWNIVSGTGDYETLRGGGATDSISDGFDASTGRVWLGTDES